MWAIIKWLVMKLAVVRWILKILGGFGVLLPIALLLKSIGWPILLVLGVLLLPVLVVLFLFGLPIFLVLIVGSMIMSFVFAVLSFGMVVLKFAITVVLPIFLVWKAVSWMFRKRNGGDRHPDVPPPPPPPAPPPPPPPPPYSGSSFSEE